MGKWFNRNFKTIIYVSFLIPIVTVAIVSISHVTQWYGISNPLSWAVYLSIGIEIAALSALAAISAQMGSKVYFPFGIVTLIQFVGNIFFAFEYIKIDSSQFLSWVELMGPILEYTGIEQGDLQSHRRFLAIFSGGMLPLISLSFLHMLVKFNEENKKTVSSNETEKEDIVDSTDTKTKEEPIPASDIVAEVSRFRPSQEELDRIEELLEKFPHEEPKKRPTKEEQREILTQMMRESEEMGLYDEPFNNPIIKDSKTPQSASEMMISSDEDIINSIPSDEEMSDWDLPSEPPSWMDEIPEPTEEDFREWDVTLQDGLDDVLYEDNQVEPDNQDIKEIEVVDPVEVRSVNVILDELPSTPNLEFNVDTNIVTPAPEPTKRPANRYEELGEYLNQTTSWDQNVVEENVIPEITSTPQINPNFVVRQPIQDQEDPEKKN
jgi:hypothetical protein